MTTETPEPTYDYYEAKRRIEWFQGMRALVDFFEQHPQLKPPVGTDIFNVFVTKEELTTFARVAGWTKEYTDTWFMLRRKFGEVTLDVNIERGQVCRQVEVGEKVVPAQPATPERVEKVYEWVCDDASLLADPRRI